MGGGVGGSGVSGGGVGGSVMSDGGVGGSGVSGGGVAADEIDLVGRERAGGERSSEGGD